MKKNVPTVFGDTICWQLGQVGMVGGVRADGVSRASRVFTCSALIQWRFPITTVMRKNVALK